MILVSEWTKPRVLTPFVRKKEETNTVPSPMRTSSCWASTAGRRSKDCLAWRGEHISPSSAHRGWERNNRQE